MGAGSWGTAFAKVLADAGNDVTLWARRPELAETITRTGQNPDYLPGIELPRSIVVSHDVSAVVSGADLVAIAVPAQTLRSNLAEWAPGLPDGASLMSLMKGVEEHTSDRMSQVIAEVTGADDKQIAVLSGPNLAREIAEEHPTATVIACSDADRAEALQHACFTPYFRPYTNEDVIGCEFGGAVKNVIALACGMASGMGFGANTLASIVTRGLAETARLGAAMGADPMTFAGLAGLGDLVATCSSPLSRNRSFGERLGRGESVEQAQEATHGQVAEGVRSARPILELAGRHGIDVPITQAVDAVCSLGLAPAEMVGALMTRTRKSE